jgi:hypothetical protein
MLSKLLEMTSLITCTVQTTSTQVSKCFLCRLLRPRSGCSLYIKIINFLNNIKMFCVAVLNNIVCSIPPMFLFFRNHLYFCVWCLATRWSSSHSPQQLGCLSPMAAKITWPDFHALLCVRLRGGYRLCAFYTKRYWSANFSYYMSHTTSVFTVITNESLELGMLSSVWVQNSVWKYGNGAKLLGYVQQI